jgi:hypothetical protein
MRRSGVILLLVGFVLAWPVRGQDRVSVFTGGMKPQTVTMKPMDTTRAMTPPQMSRLPQFSPQRPMSGSSFFPKFSLGSWPPRLPTPSFLSGKNTVQPAQVKSPFELKN